jgi:hypothetical protein
MQLLCDLSGNWFGNVRSAGNGKEFGLTEGVCLLKRKEEVQNKRGRECHSTVPTSTEIHEYPNKHTPRKEMIQVEAKL